VAHDPGLVVGAARTARESRQPSGDLVGDRSRHAQEKQWDASAMDELERHGQGPIARRRWCNWHEDALERVHGSCPAG
jgi:hypothetical protein